MILLNVKMELTMIYVLLVAHSFVEHSKRLFHFKKKYEALLCYCSHLSNTNYIYQIIDLSTFDK